MLEVSFTLTGKDVLPYLTDWAIVARERKQKRSLRIVAWTCVYYVLLIGVSCLLFWMLYERNISFDTSLVITIVMGTGWRWLLDRLWNAAFSKQTQAMPHLLGEHHVKILPEGLRDTTGNFMWTVFWPGISDIALMEHNIIFISEYNGAFPVPRQAFQEVEAYQNFYENSLALWRQSAWPPAPCAGDSQELGETAKR